MKKWYPTSEQAWIEINRSLIQEFIPNSVVMKNQVILYDVFFQIGRSYIPEDWDFTKTVNYTRAKWTSLVGNYIDMTHLEEVLSLVRHRELKKDRNYNVSFWFSNKYGGGKGCLLSCTFSRRYGEDIPILNAVMRAAEFYKRGAFDLLLLHRMGQEAFGEDSNFGVNIFAHQLWGGSDWLSLLSSIIPPEELFKNVKPGSFHAEVEKMYHYFKGIKDIEGLKYHAHKRACKVIQDKINPRRLLANQCTL